MITSKGARDLLKDVHFPGNKASSRYMVYSVYTTVSMVTLHVQVMLIVHTLSVFPGRGEG